MVGLGHVHPGKRKKTLFVLAVRSFPIARKSSSASAIRCHWASSLGIVQRQFWSCRASSSTSAVSRFRPFIGVRNRPSAVLRALVVDRLVEIVCGPFDAGAKTNAAEAKFSYQSGSPAARSAAISASSRDVSLRNWVSVHELMVNFGSARRSRVAQAFAFSGCPSSW